MSDEITDKDITVKESKLAALLDRITEYEAKEDKIAECCFQALKVIGLVTAEGQFIPELKEGKNVIGVIMHHIKDNFSFTEFLWNKKKAEADLAEKFSFLKDLLPLFKDYADRKQRQAGTNAGA